MSTRIDELRGLGISLSGKEYKDLLKPMIYIWKRKDIYLYVGKSIRGFRRLLSYHHVLSNYDIEDDDIFETILCSSNLESEILERDLIKSYKPVYNYRFLAIDKQKNKPILVKVCKECNKEFKTQDIRKSYCSNRCDIGEGNTPEFDKIFNKAHQPKIELSAKVKEALKVLGVNDINKIKALIK